MRLSVVIPAKNESDTIEQTVRSLVDALTTAKIEFEIIVVDDASTDDTAASVSRAGAGDPRVICMRSHLPPGFGHAVRAGLDVYTGDAVAIVMADGSDHPDDLVAYHVLLEAGWECVFGSRFIAGAAVSDYPRVKLAINRIVNFGVRLLFRTGYNDTTNAFKAYRREVIDGIKPLLANHFNLTVEMPLKAMVRGYRYTVVPIRWTNRTAGASKLSLKEMGSRYAFIVLYVWLERHLSRGDYRRDDESSVLNDRLESSG